MASTKEEHIANVQLRLETISMELARASRARKYGDSIRAYALGMHDDISQYAHHFIPRYKMPVCDIEAIVADRKKLEKKERIRKRKEQAEREKAQQERLERWLSGEGGFNYGFTGTIRLRAKGDNIETMHGASVPIADALNLFALCEACRKNERGMDSFTHKVGSFLPTSIDKKGNAKVGCHDLSFDEMERMAKEIA